MKTPPHPKTGKVGKLPINPHTGLKASTTNRSTWGTIDDALQRARADGLAGVGFVFTDDDDFVGIDLDQVLDPTTGKITRAWATRVLELLGAGPHFVERSQSGLGLKIIVRGDLPVTGKRRDKVDGDSGIEVYRTTRFFALTTNLYDGYSPVKECAEVPADALEKIISEYAGYDSSSHREPEAGVQSDSGEGMESRPRWYGSSESIPDGITADQLVLDGIQRDKRFESQLALTWEKKLKPRAGSDASQSGWDLRLARLLIYWGLPDRFVESLLHKYRTQHSADSSDPDKALRPDYLRSTLAAAREIIGSPCKSAEAQLEVGVLDYIAKQTAKRKRRKRTSQKNSREGQQIAAREGAGRPTVSLYPSEMPRSNDIAQQALVMRESALGRHRKLFSRGGVLVQLVISPDGDAASIQVRVGAIREHMGRAAKFQKVTDDPEEPPTLVDYPKDYGAAYLDRGEWPFPQLKGIARVPLLLGTGRLITSPGYDDEAGVYVDIVEGEWREAVPDDPSEEDARGALAVLVESIRDFPFVGKSDMSVALAAILTAVARNLFDFAPLIAISAPSRSAGKSELVELVAMIATGHRAPGYQFRNDVIEMDKLFHSLFLESVPCVHLENVEVELRGAPLCTAISQARYARRTLGFSATSAPATTGTTWLASGVNLVVASDVVRRVLRCELDPMMERPEERRFDRNLSKWARERRQILVGAALTIIAAYFRADRPPQEYPPWAGFEDWCSTIRAPLLWLGVADPCAQRHRLDEEDPERDDLALILGVLWTAYAGARFTSHDVEARWKAGDEVGECLRVACSDVLEELTGRALGNYLRGRKNRLVNGLRCIKAKKQGHRVLWQIERVGEGAAGGMDVGRAGADACHSPENTLSHGLWDSKVTCGSEAPPAGR